MPIYYMTNLWISTETKTESVVKANFFKTLIDVCAHARSQRLNTKCENI